jgi:putative NADPH-quinone reductase
MKVLTVFAHPGSGSLCHGVLERFDAGLRAAGHTNEIVDLYAIRFDPVLRERDNPNWMDADAPDDVIASMHLRERILEGAGNRLRRFATKRWLRDAIRVLVDEFAMRYPGIKRVGHEYLYAVHDADSAKVSRYLERAYQLGCEF